MPVFEQQQKSFVEDGFIKANSTFFNIFTAPLIKGNPQNAFRKLHAVVITESTARKIFGNQDPMGESLKIGQEETHYKITGIIKGMPETTHIKCNIIGSFVTDDRSESGHWLANNLLTYVMLSPNASVQKVEDQIMDLLHKHAGPLLQEYMGISFKEFEAQGNKYGYYL